MFVRMFLSSLLAILTVGLVIALIKSRTAKEEIRKLLKWIIQLL